MKILIIRFSSIGDIVLTTPVVRCIKQQLPDVELHYLTKKGFGPVLRGNPHIDHLHFLDSSFEHTVEALKAEQFDWVIDLHHNLRTLRLKRALGVPSKSFNKLNIQKWLLTNLKVNLLPKQHIVERYLATVQHLGVRNDGKGLDYFIPDEEITRLQDIPAGHHLGYIGLVIGAAHATKRLPLHKLKLLVEKIAHPIVLMGGPEDKTTGELLSALDPVKIYNACGKFSINESADLVRKAKLIITHDTGLMHIAAAFKKPVISVWGNTVPAFGMTPYLVPTETRVEVTGLRCRPCSKIGYEACPRRHFKCMEDIDLDLIHKNAQQLLAAQ